MLPYNKKQKNLEPYYTNEDIAFLHDIVVQAENVLPSLPKRERLPTNALFQAYYEFLPRIGVDADHDSRYARILFKIGGLRGDGTLYEKFEAVLAKLGIEIEFDQLDEEDIEEEYGNERQASVHGSERADCTDYIEFELPGNGPRGRPRANSESSMWIGNETPHHRDGRTRSFSPSAKLLSEPFDPRKDISRLQNDERHTNRRAQQPDESHEGPRLAESIEHASKQQLKSWTSEYDHIRASRQVDPLSADTSGPTSDDFTDTSGLATQSSDANYGKDPRGLPGTLKRAPVPVLKPSATLMELKSTLAYENHLKTLRRPLLRVWHTRTEQQREKLQGLLQAAHERDNDHLLRDTLELWRFRLLQREQEKKLEVFFQKTEERVEKTRNSMLVQKSFQKWASRSAIQKARTNEAKEHILRTRYFQAWFKITAVNEVKVEQHTIKKFFGAWKSKIDTVVANTKAAAGLYEGNVVKRMLKNWLYGAENKMMSTEELFHKERILNMWLARVCEFKENENPACEPSEVGLLKTSLTIWREKTQAILETNVDAEFFFRENYGRNLLQGSFSIWNSRSHLEIRATRADQFWTMKAALTALRIGLIKKISDKRVARNALQSWRLATRLQVTKRVLDERRKHQTLLLLRNKSTAGRQVETDLEARAQEFRDRRLVASAIGVWRQCIDVQQEQKITAMDHHASHIAFNALKRWFEKHEHVQSMNYKAEQAIYFFRTQNILKRWNEAAKTSHKDRGRAAYAQVRRMVKIRTARDVIATWREKAKQVRDNLEQAAEFSHNKNVVFATEAFDKWRTRTEDIEQMALQAKAKSNKSLLKRPLQMWRAQATANINYRTKLLSLQLSKWRFRLEAHEQNEARARDFLNNRSAIMCSRVLNKWSNDAFQIRIQVRTEQMAQELKAEEYLDRCNKKHFRKFFKYWRIRMLEKRGIDTNQLRQVSRIAGSTPVNKRSAFGGTAKNEEWSAFDEDFDAQDLNRQLGVAGASTPTPSRRLNMSQSLVKAPVTATPSRRPVNQLLVKASTTPGTPLSTPLERQLRKGLFSSAPRTQPPVRSALGRSVFTQGFADITEVSKEDGGDD